MAVNVSPKAHLMYANVLLVIPEKIANSKTSATLKIRVYVVHVRMILIIRLVLSASVRQVTLDNVANVL
jgi:hypothetical protein